MDGNKSKLERPKGYTFGRDSFDSYTFRFCETSIRKHVSLVTLQTLQNKLKQQVQTAALELFGVELEAVNAETPPRPELGDLAFPVAFELAKLVKQGTGVKLPPRSIAEQLKQRLEKTPEVSRIDVAGAGYLNLFFDRASLLRNFLGEPAPEIPMADRPKQMVEHTSINPNKAAHIGHVRNAVLGDTFVRILTAAGNRVEVQNYIDDTGVQVISSVRARTDW